MEYAAMRDSVRRAEDGRHETVFEGPDMECLASVGDALLVGTLDGGLWRGEVTSEASHLGTANRRSAPVSGADFERVDPDGTSDRVTSVAASPHDPAVCWADTEPSMVWRSEDGRRTWREREGLTDLPSEPEWAFPPRPHTHHTRWISPNAHDPGRLYVGVEAGAFVLASGAEAGEIAVVNNHGVDRSGDGGRSWTTAVEWPETYREEAPRELVVR